MSRGRGDGDPGDGGLSNTAKRYLAGQTGRDYQCQIGLPNHTPFSAPWRGAQRESDKTQLFKYVRSLPEGVPLSRVVRDVFGQSAVNNADKDYQLARRFFESCSWFKTARRRGYLWVEPTLELFHLSQQYANRKTSGRRGDGLSNGERQSKTGDSSRADSPTVSTQSGQSASRDGVGSPQYPTDRAQSILDKRVHLDGRNGHDYRAELQRELGTEREIQQDKFKILSRVRGSGPGHLLIPYLTRFNDTDRAGDTQDRFRTALQQASQRHQDAVVVTLTSDAKRFSSVSEALDGLTEAKGRFMSWLSTDYQLGKRPDNLSVLEWTAGGLPHVHLVLFGIDWLLPQSKISAKWDSLGQGSVVDIRSAEAERGGQRWFLHNDDGSRVTLRQYLGKAIRGLQDVADMDAGQLREAAEAGDIEYWRQALYWATGRQHASCSPSLKDTDSDDLPHVAVYEFVGVAQYRSIPAHVRQSAVVLTRDSPPPD